MVEDQTTWDIVREIDLAHKDNARDYDRICEYFEVGNVPQICQALWVFCKENFPFREEDIDTQNVLQPISILQYPSIDCKNYASFCGGVLDALKRKGYPIVWEYRFVSWTLWKTSPSHVFIVVNPSTQDIWIDPVADYYDDHIWYWHKVSKRPRTAAVGSIGSIGCGCGCETCNGASIGAAPAVNSLLADLKAYSDGLTGAVVQTHQTGAFNSITTAVIEGIAAVAIPAIGAVLALVKAGAVLFDKEFGVGAASSRILTDIGNLNISALFNDIFNGRTYQSDQYWAGVYYEFYVLGNNVTDPNYVSDAQVLPALKWFVDRTGVFISGREHIIALTQSSQAYLNYYSVNPDTTTDPVRVAAASKVARTYWKNPGNFSASLKGSWAATVGVYDLGLVQLAQSYGETPEQLAAQTGTTDQVAENYLNPTTSHVGLFVIIGATALGIILANKK